MMKPNKKGEEMKKASKVFTEVKKYYPSLIKMGNLDISKVKKILNKYEI